MRIKSLGLIVLIVFTCQNCCKRHKALTADELLYECDSVCSKYLYVYTTYTINSEKKRFLDLKDSLTKSESSPVLLERIDAHLKKIRIAEDYFKKLSNPLGFYKATLSAAYVQKVKPPCPCPTTLTKQTCECLITALVAYDEGGTEIEEVTVNDAESKIVSQETENRTGKIEVIKGRYYPLIRARIFKLKEPIHLFMGDVIKVKISTDVRDSTGKIQPQIIEHTEIMR